MKKRFNLIVIGLIILVSHLLSAAPKNIILFISDGCGFNHVKATGYYQYGEKGRQPYETFSVTAAMSTYAQNGDYKTKKAWRNFKYLINKYTDSAASATAMATGHKTYNGAIGVDKNTNNLKNVIQYAEENRKSTGVISSVYFSHATPAGFVAHNTDRNNYKEIAREMLMDSKIEVLMGCGHPFYNDNGDKVSGEDQEFDYQNQSGEAKKIDVEYKYVGGEKVWRNLVNGNIGNDSDYDGKIENWKLIQERHEFQEYALGETPERLLGIPQVRSTLQYAREGKEDKPFQVPFSKNIPSLSEMTLAGLNVLDNNHKGFFLMVEAGAVDWASHGNNSARMIEEQIDLNNAVENAINWINDNSNWEETLIIVTADHECGYLNGPGSGGTRKNGEPIDSVWKPIENRGKGKMPGMQWYHGSHSNSLVPFYAEGAGAELFIEKADENDLRYGIYLDNTELAQVLIDLLK